ncbi:MAG TPA: hypothetical protein VHB54_16280 [Mucilaginibacter sp.]|nr:hypothetical protein [Mucilaginibacter sp.]
MIKGVALGITLKNAHRQVLIDEENTGKKPSEGLTVYHLMDNENNADLGVITFSRRKDNWDYKGPLSDNDLYQIARFIQNYNDEDWNF